MASIAADRVRCPGVIVCGRDVVAGGVTLPLV